MEKNRELREQRVEDAFQMSQDRLLRGGTDTQMWRVWRIQPWIWGNNIPSGTDSKLPDFALTSFIWIEKIFCAKDVSSYVDSSWAFRVHLGKTSHYFSTEVFFGGGGGGVPRGIGYEIDLGKKNYFISFPNFFGKKKFLLKSMLFFT